MTGAPPVARRTVVELLRDRTFGPFIAGKMLSNCGVWLQNLAAAVLMFELTGSAAMVGAVSMLQFAGPLVLAFWAGALTDLVDRRKLLIGGRMLSGSAVGALALLLAVRGPEQFGGPRVLLVVAVLMGVGLAFSGPAQQALVPSLVPRSDMETALAMSSAGPSVAMTVGPAIAAGLLLVGGPGLAFAVAATAHWVFVVVLLTRVGPRRQEQENGRPSLLGGLRYLVRDRAAGLSMLGIAVVGFGADPVITLSPSLADQMGGGSETVGLLATAYGIGAVLLTIFFNRFRRFVSLHRFAVVGFCILPLGWVVAAFAPTVLFLTAGFFVAGWGYMMATVALKVRIQLRVPDQLRGRVMALWAVAFLGSRPFAAMINGMLADLVSVRVALCTSALVVLAALLLLGASNRVSQPA